MAQRAEGVELNTKISGNRLGAQLIGLTAETQRKASSHVLHSALCPLLYARFIR